MKVWLLLLHPFLPLVHSCVYSFIYLFSSSILSAPRSSKCFLSLTFSVALRLLSKITFYNTLSYTVTIVRVQTNDYPWIRYPSVTLSHKRQKTQDTVNRKDGGGDSADLLNDKGVGTSLQVFNGMKILCLAQVAVLQKKVMLYCCWSFCHEVTQSFMSLKSLKFDNLLLKNGVEQSIQIKRIKGPSFRSLLPQKSPYTAHLFWHISLNNPAFFIWFIRFLK